MSDGVRLLEFPAESLAILLLTAVGYVALRYLFFDRAQRRARRNGVLGHY
ncbi:hypothetical protein [Haladaptatus halobius]|nr:hypothetical protein [Haladaptatus halobius]